MEDRPRHLLNNGDNIAPYEFQTQAFAIFKNCGGILDGTEVRPADLPAAGNPNAQQIAANAVLQREFDVREGILYYYFATTQAPNALPVIAHIPAGRARLCWVAILNQYRSGSRAATVQCLMALVNLTQQGDALSFVQRIDELRHQLESNVAALELANAALDVADRVTLVDLVSLMVLLRGLSAEFRTLAQSLLTNEVLTWRQARTNILGAAERFKFDKHMSAKAVTAPAVKPIISLGAAKVPCTGCQKSGHEAANCWVLHPELKAAYPHRSKEKKSAASASAASAAEPHASASVLPPPPLEGPLFGAWSATMDAAPVLSVPTRLTVLLGVFDADDEDSAPDLLDYCDCGIPGLVDDSSDEDEDESPPPPARRQFFNSSGPPPLIDDDSESDDDDSENLRARARTPAAPIRLAASVARSNTVTDPCAVQHTCSAEATALRAAAVSAVADPSIVVAALDSAATHNFVTSCVQVTDFDSTDTRAVALADGKAVPSTGSGTINNMSVYVVPSFTSNLWSVPALLDDGFACLFHPAGCRVYNVASNETFGAVERIDRGFTIRFPVGNMSARKAAKAPLRIGGVTVGALHLNRTQRVAFALHSVFHSSTPRLVEAANQQHFAGFDAVPKLTAKDFPEHCDACSLAKITRPRHPGADPEHRATTPYQRIHIDGKCFRTGGWRGEYASLIIVDDFSGAAHVIPTQSRSDFIPALRRFHSQVIKSSGYTLSIVRSDGAGEFTGAYMDALLTEIGARAELTVPHTPQQNGRAERKIRTIMEGARVIRITCDLPSAAKYEAMKTAAHLDNFLPSSANPDNKSPVEMLIGKPPAITFLRPIGCHVTVHIDPAESIYENFGPAGRPGVLIGYSEQRKAYRILVDKARGIVIESDRVVFHNLPIQPTARSLHDEDDDALLFVEAEADDETPNAILLPPQQIAPVHQVAPVQQADAQQVVTALPAPLQETGQPLRRSSRSHKPTQQFAEFSVVLPPSLAASDSPPALASTPSAMAAKIPFKVAESDPMLRQSMLKELNALIEEGKVTLEKLPEGRKAIGVTWAHKVKHDQYNRPTYAKSRICPQGFSQVKGLDYDPDEVPAPAVNLASVFLMLGIVVQRNMESVLYDVDAAFALSPLKEEIFMRIPDGMVKMVGYALKLHNSLNGLKQAAFNWHTLAQAFLVSQGFQFTAADPCLFYRWSVDRTALALIALYVDDFRCAFDSSDERAAFKKSFESVFPIKELSGEYYLGMMCIHDRVNGTMSVSHEAYIDNMLERFNMSDCHPVSTPSAPGTKLPKLAESDPVDAEAALFPYRQVVGALLWLARCTFPEMLYSVNQLGAHTHRFNTVHVTAAKRCLQYAKGKKTQAIVLRKGPTLELCAYADSDYCGEPEGDDNAMKSITSIVIYFIGVGFIFAQSSLQTTVSRSTAESEYRCAGACCQVIMGLRNQMEELGLSQATATGIHGDNEACIKMTKNVVCSSSLRHIRNDHHFIRQCVRNNEVVMLPCTTENMVADIGTKALPKALFLKHNETLHYKL
jgi:hypothetical protein